MGLSGPRFSNTLYSNLTGVGFTGAKLHLFTDAVGIGSDSHVSGKSFATADTGTVPGHGTGVGTGLTGIAGVATQIYALATGFGFTGSKLMEICTAIEMALITEMGNASLNSIDFPVYLGVGNIVPGSIAVVSSGWSSSIQSQGAGDGFIGSKWPEFSQAIGGGCYTGFQTATGTLAITGSPIGAPSGGSGTGTGTIS